MTGLPEGFVLDSQTDETGLPQGFQIDAPEKGFFGRMEDNFEKRNSQADEIVARYKSGDQGLLHKVNTTAQMAVKPIAGFAQDEIGDAIGTTAKFLGRGFSPEEKAIAGKVGDFLNPALDYAANAYKPMTDKYQAYAKENPQFANYIDGFFNVAGLVPTASVATKIAPIASDIAMTTAKAIPAAAKFVGKAALPSVDEGLRDVALLAQKHEIPLSFDQVTKSRAVKNMQKVSQELPFSGQDAFRDKQVSAWQKKLLGTVGSDGDKITKSIMDEAFTRVGKEFDDLGAGKTFQFDDNFSRNLDTIRQDAKSLYNEDSINNFENEVSKLLSEADNAGSVSGEKLASARSRINSLARKTNNPDTQELLHDLENAVIDTMTTNDPAAKAQFSETKRKYKNLLAIEPLAAKAKGGNISPSLLNNRVSKLYGRSHTRGTAGDIGELAQIGHELLPELGGSDTVQKLIYAAKAGAGIGASTLGAAIDPVSTAATLTANRLLQSGLNRNQSLLKAALKGGKK